MTKSELKVKRIKNGTVIDHITANRSLNILNMLKLPDDETAIMVAINVESSDMGKLYLNYPMVESFYHMKSIPDDDYWSYTATMQELSNHIYKSRVAAENRNHDYSKFAVDKSECNIVIKQNIEKAWKIVKDDISFQYERILPDPADVLDIQLKKLKEDNALFVLCTCVFYIPDYNSKLIAE